jgi:hypothetical protein
MFADLWNWIVSFWWTVVVTAGLSFFAISFLFNKIIESEMDRGGEEYGERATTRIQKWSTAILFSSGFSFFGAIGFKIAQAFGLI